MKRRSRQRGRWVGAAASARAKILASSVILLALSAVLSSFAIREIHELRLDDQVRDGVLQEVLELERLLAIGRDPQTGRAFTSPGALFDVYLARNVPSSEEAFLTYVDGRFYRAVLANLPLDEAPPRQSADWARLATPASDAPETVSGAFETEAGKAYFAVRRVRLGSGAGAFVVVNLPTAEYDEIRDLQIYGAAATLTVLLIASVFAYLIAGRVLAPVRQVTETAESISRSDLTRRINVFGAGDAAEMARSFNAMLDRLEAVFRSQRDFVQDASHELRTPLTVSRGHLELLGDDPDERRETLALVMDELDRMGRMVDDLQLLAETEQLDFLRVETIDAEPFAMSLHAKMGALAARNWILDPSGGGTFAGDRHRLTEAMLNLAHNAVEHTDAGDSIAVGVNVLGDQCRMWVVDTGIGISPSDHARIFDRFVRGEDAPQRYRGSGLGLAIVRAIVDAHRGRVEVESRLGEGATFTIVIPVIGGQGDLR